MRKRRVRARSKLTRLWAQLQRAAQSWTTHRARYVYDKRTGRVWEVHGVKDAEAAVLRVAKRLRRKHAAELRTIARPLPDEPITTLGARRK